MRRAAEIAKPAPVNLYQCTSPTTQMAWIERALRAGRTLSDSGLWLGGVDKPEQLIAKLRKTGLAIETTTKLVVDAADDKHDDLAWRLEQGSGEAKG